MPRPRRPSSKPPDSPKSPEDSGKKSAPPSSPLPPPPSPETPEPNPRTLAEAVAARVGQARFGLWFRGQTRFIALGRVVVVAVRNEQAQDSYDRLFGAAVREAVAEVHGPGVEVEWVVDERAVDVEDAEVLAGNGRTVPKEGKEEDPSTQLDLFGQPVAAARPKARRDQPEVEPPVRSHPIARPDRRFKALADFVVGPDTRFAHTMALSVVENPGSEANPLVIHGPVGTGKTHLLEGIYSGLKRRADQQPLYMTAKEFLDRYVPAVKEGKMGAFRRRFEACTALLFDDLHFLASKKSTQGEFLSVFDDLLSEGKQVVVTMDCHPRHAEEIMPELVDRLLGGAVWGLLPPDPDTRLAILRKKAANVTPPIPETVLRSLANSLRGNVRELELAVNTLRHYSRVTGKPIDLALASEALGDLLRHAIRPVTIADVDAAVCALLRLSAGSLRSRSRAWAVTHPRMIAIYLCRKHTAATFNEIAKYFGASTHSTAVNSEKKVRTWVEENRSISIGERNWQAKELIHRIEVQLQK